MEVVAKNALQGSAVRGGSVNSVPPLPKPAVLSVVLEHWSAVEVTPVRIPKRIIDTAVHAGSPAKTANDAVEEIAGRSSPITTTVVPVAFSVNQVKPAAMALALM